MIRTRLHILADNVDPKTMQRGGQHEFVRDMLNAASFVIDSDVLELVQREDCRKSIKALVEAGMWRLPYSPMVIEYEVDGKGDGNAHSFVYLYEKGEDIYGRVILMELQKYTAVVGTHELFARVIDNEIMVEGSVYMRHQSSPAHRLFLHSFAVAVHLALLMLNTKGIEKTVVHVAEGLNKKRTARGHAVIPHHTTVHIGTIYRRDGTAIKRGEGGGGWHMPMHWRCGYTRRQHYGAERAKERMVYIPPCIVNFKPEEDTPHVPMRKVKI